MNIEPTTGFRPT